MSTNPELTKGNDLNNIFTARTTIEIDGVLYTLSNATITMPDGIDLTRSTYTQNDSTGYWINEDALEVYDATTTGYVEQGGSGPGIVDTITYKGASYKISLSADTSWMLQLSLDAFSDLDAAIASESFGVRAYTTVSPGIPIFRISTGDKKVYNNEKRILTEDDLSLSPESGSWVPIAQLVTAADSSSFDLPLPNLSDYAGLKVWFSGRATADTAESSWFDVRVNGSNTWSYSGTRLVFDQANSWTESCAGTYVSAGFIKSNTTVNFEGWSFLLSGGSGDCQQWQSRLDSTQVSFTKMWCYNTSLPTRITIATAGKVRAGARVVALGLTP